ncbi:hypothetical protein [Hyphomicrobium sp. D-2]|uniref:hypothetical protein n=1 Tax=Hyphomicrobium sp. D-2 TaxID=3041621 RepID=UPI002456A053|nr:hypothetical protein [Hyphomicrobium sp. D-2]MDH4982941.1 hypothetical protein [Hyphomicrobium sp. D-2]
MRILVLAVAICLSAVAALAAKKNVRGWEIEPRFENGQLQYCMMSGIYQRGQVFGVLLTREFNWSISIADPRWKLVKDRPVSAVVMVDGQRLTLQAAEALTTQTAMIMLAHDQAFRAFQRGNGMTISINGMPVRMSLAGTHAAMSALVDCVASNNRTTTASIETGSLGDNVMLSESEALVMVSNLLSQAGISGYSLRPPSNGVVSWTFANGSRGVFYGFKRFAGSIDKLASDTVAIIGEECVGDFASAKKVGMDSDGTHSRKVSMACSSGGTVHEYYVHVLQLQSLAAVFMHSGPSNGTEDGRSLEAANDSVASQAVITYPR